MSKARMKNVGGVLVDVGDYSAITKLEKLEPGDYYRLMLMRQSFVQTTMPADCRRLVEFVDDADRMFEVCGFASANDMILRGLKCDPEEVELRGGLASCCTAGIPDPVRCGVENRAA